MKKITLEQSRQAIMKDLWSRQLSELQIDSEKKWLASFNAMDAESAGRYLKFAVENDEFFNLLLNYREASYLLHSSELKLDRINQLVDGLLARLGKDKEYADQDSQKQIKDIQQLAADLLARTNSHIFKAKKQRDEYAGRLKDLSLQMLAQRKQQLDVYLVQARLGLAQAYDRLEQDRGAN